MRLCLIASKPTDAVTYGFLPAAERLGLEVFLLTDQPEAHVGALARAAVVTAQWPAGTGPAGERALAGPVPGIAFAVVAGGTHHLRTPAAKGHDQPCAVISVPDWPAPWPRPGVSAQAVTITGQLCTPKDVLARRVTVKRLRAGDVVAFGLAGAYAWNISHHELPHAPATSFSLSATTNMSCDNEIGG